VSLSVHLKDVTWSTETGSTLADNLYSCVIVGIFSSVLSADNMAVVTVANC